MKRYKTYELIQAVIENKLKLTQKVSSLDKRYKNCTIDFVLKDLAINIMNLEFELIEDEIDIQAIEEINLFDNGQGYNDIKTILGGYDTNFNQINDKFNEMIQAIKQTDKNLSKFKYLYEAVNEDI